MALTRIAVRDLGRMPYPDALAVQREVHSQVVAETTVPTLLLVEHDPAITVSRRPAAREHLLADPKTLATLGIKVYETDRGGDITYHGPGQLVAYPIVRLVPLGLNIGRYIRLLEQVLLRVVGTFGIRGYTDPGFTGLWVGHARPLKLGAIGVRVQRNVTLHGVALNVSPNLDHYKTIVPCGLTGRGVTSLEQQSQGRAPSMDQIKGEFVNAFRTCLEYRAPVSGR